MLGAVNLVARFDRNGELSLSEVVHGARGVGAGLELAAAGAVRGVLLVLLEPAKEEAEVALICVQAVAHWRGAAGGAGGERRLQGDHVRVRTTPSTPHRFFMGLGLGLEPIPVVLEIRGEKSII